MESHNCITVDTMGDILFGPIAESGTVTSSMKCSNCVYHICSPEGHVECSLRGQLPYRKMCKDHYPIKRCSDCGNLRTVRKEGTIYSECYVGFTLSWTDIHCDGWVKKTYREADE